MKKQQQLQKEYEQKIIEFWEEKKEHQLKRFLKYHRPICVKDDSGRIKQCPGYREVKDNLIFSNTYESIYGKRYKGAKVYNKITSDEFTNGWLWYHGTLKKGDADGVGMLKFRNQRILFGQFKNDKINGFAVSMTPDRKSKFVGYFKNNKRDGKGKLYRDGILMFDGNYKLDNETSGKLYRDNGTLRYDGHSKYNEILGASQFHGKGKLYYPNGNLKYNGDFKHNLFDGKGKLYHPNGNLGYNGHFKNNRPYGKGKLYDTNEKLIHDGYFDGFFLGKMNFLSLQQKQKTRRALQNDKKILNFMLQQLNPREYLKEKGNLLFFNGKDLYGANVQSISQIYDDNEIGYIRVDTTGGTRLYFTEILEYHIKNGDNFFYFKPHHKTQIRNVEETINTIYFKDELSELTQQQQQGDIMQRFFQI
jgi:antitoxin component YwqK of YwqJK toxin-antitoxin module